MGLRKPSARTDIGETGELSSGRKDARVTTETDLTWRTCPVCGYLVPTQQATCKKCESLAAAAEVPTPTPPTAPLPPTGSEFLLPNAAWTADRPRDRRPIWILVGAIVAVVALLAGLVGSGAFDSGPSYPAKWDARLGDLPATVERLRGLSFDHAVPVRFLGEAAFKKEVGVDPKPSKAARRTMKRFTAQLRAGGLISGEVDLLKAIDTEQQSSVLAFYSPDKKAVVVRGLGAPDAAHRVTLAHELTHVLQDQHFDLNAIEARVKHDPESSSQALRAFIEGDANRIEDKYVKTLSAADRTAYRKGRKQEVSKADSGSSSVPAIVSLEFSAPYRYGPPVLQVVAADGGNANVDRAFEHGVFTQQMFIEPSAPLTESKPRHVADPKLRSGEKAIGKAEGFGAFDLYLLLGSRIDPAVALGAAVDWAGGRGRMVRVDGRTCMRSVVEAETPKGNDRLAADFTLWAGMLPAGMAEIGRRGSAVAITSCDLGATSTLTSPDLAIERAGAMLDLHSEIEAALSDEAAKAGAPPSTARCFALAIAQSPEVGLLLQQTEESVTSEMAQGAVRDAAEKARAKCLS